MAAGLAVPVIPLTELEELYWYAQAIAAAYEQLGHAEGQVGYSPGPSEAGPTSGGPGHGDPVAGQTGRDGGIRDAEVRDWRRTLSREARWVQREIAKRTPRLYRELGWEHPNAQRERAEGYRDNGGRLVQVVGQ